MADKNDLLRVVAVEGALLPDPSARQPGRGAYLHPTATCLDLAVRRRAFVRALRLERAPDVAVLRVHLAPTVESGSDR